MPFLEHLVKRGLITEAQVSEINRLATDKYEGDIDRTLEDFKIDSIQLLAIKGAYFNVPVKNVDVKSIAPDIFKYIPLDSANLYKFAPIGLADGVLEVGITKPRKYSSNGCPAIYLKQNKYAIQSFLDIEYILQKYYGCLSRYRG